MKKFTFILAFFKYLRFNRKFLKSKNVEYENIILNEVSDLRSFSLSSSYFAKTLSNKYKSRVISYYFWIFDFKDYINILIKLLNPFSNFYVYKSFSNKILFPFYFQKLKSKKNQIFKSKKDLLNLKYNNIIIGDLIYDDFLARNKLATIDINSYKFIFFLNRYFKIIEYWNSFIKTNKVSAIIISHSVYCMGLLGRIGLSKKVPVYVISPISHYKLTKKNYIKWSDQNRYPYLFKTFNENIKKKILLDSKYNLSNRLSGKKDFRYNISNPIKPVFTGKKIFKKKSNNDIFKVLIASHCFSDAPHVYGKLLFSDFFEWLQFLGKLTNHKKTSNYIWYIKPHPAFYNLEHNIYEKLVIKYPKMKLLNPEITHNETINNFKIEGILTVFGSVGHEFPLFNIPVINAGNNPHSGYDFNLNPKNLKEYKRLILNFKNIKIKKNVQKKIYEFYGMHHLIDYSFFSNFLDNINEKIGFDSFQIYYEFIKKINLEIHFSKINIYNKFINGKNRRLIDLNKFN